MLRVLVSVFPRYASAHMRFPDASDIPVARLRISTRKSESSSSITLVFSLLSSGSTLRKPESLIHFQTTDAEQITNLLETISTPSHTRECRSSARALQVMSSDWCVFEIVARVWGRDLEETRGGNKEGKFVWYESISPGEAVLVSGWDVRAPVDVEWGIQSR